MNKITDIISAQSTPPGKGGVALIRISGEGAVSLVEKIFKSRTGRALSECHARTQIYGDIMDGGEPLDDCLVTRFEPGSSYTGEETVEITCHGSQLLVGCILELTFRHGARAAEAGEFTRRAFINGKLSLASAEAIGNLLEAKTREQIRLSASSQRSRLDSAIADIRGELLSLMSSIFARIDYPDEDLGDFSDDEVYAILNKVRERIKRLSESYKTGKAISEGVNAVICGKPNVGKSSIYNLLLGEESAIVTDIKGTTRDVLTSHMSLGRVMLKLSDTAGIREGEGVGLVEGLGIERSRESVRGSELVLAVFDASCTLDGEDRELLSLLEDVSAVKIALLNKSDKTCVITECDLPEIFDKVITTSAQDDASRDRIASAIDALFTDERLVIGESAIIFTARQSAMLKCADESLTLAIEALSAGFGQDAVASDVERAISALSELDGLEVSELVVGDIFKKFCVGK